MKNSILAFMIFAMLAVNCILVILGIVEDNEKKVWKYLKYCGILSMVSFLLIIADIFLFR